MSGDDRNTPLHDAATAAQLIYQLDQISISCAYQAQAFLCHSGKWPEVASGVSMPSRLGRPNASSLQPSDLEPHHEITFRITPREIALFGWSVQYRAPGRPPTVRTRVFAAPNGTEPLDHSAGLLALSWVTEQNRCWQLATCDQ
jgi:hypothetical protein